MTRSRTFSQSLSLLGQSRVAHRQCSVFGNNFASRLFFRLWRCLCASNIFVTDCHTIPTFSTFSEYEKCVYGVKFFFFIKKRHEGFMSFSWRLCWSSVRYAFFCFWPVCCWAFLVAQMFLDMRWIIYCKLKNSNYLLSLGEFCIYVVSLTIFLKRIFFGTHLNWHQFWSQVDFESVSIPRSIPNTLEAFFRCQLAARWRQLIAVRDIVSDYWQHLRLILYHKDVILAKKNSNG